MRQQPFGETACKASPRASASATDEMLGPQGGRAARTPGMCGRSEVSALHGDDRMGAVGLAALHVDKRQQNDDREQRAGKLAEERDQRTDEKMACGGQRRGC